MAIFWTPLAVAHSRLFSTGFAFRRCAVLARAGGTAVFIDAEHALDSAYARAIGVDISNLYLAQPDNGEQGARERWG